MRFGRCSWWAVRNADCVARWKWWMKREEKVPHGAAMTKGATAIHIRTADTAIRTLIRMAAAMVIGGPAAAGVVRAEIGGVVASVAAHTADISFYTLQHGV